MMVLTNVSDDALTIPALDDSGAAKILGEGEKMLIPSKEALPSYLAGLVAIGHLTIEPEGEVEVPVKSGMASVLEEIKKQGPPFAAPEGKFWKLSKTGTWFQATKKGYVPPVTPAQQQTAELMKDMVAKMAAEQAQAPEKPILMGVPITIDPSGSMHPTAEDLAQAASEAELEAKMESEGLLTDAAAEEIGAAIDKGIVQKFSVKDTSGLPPIDEIVAAGPMLAEPKVKMSHMVHDAVMVEVPNGMTTAEAIKQVQAQMKPSGSQGFGCPECQQSFTDVAQLSSHLVGHKQAQQKMKLIDSKASSKVTIFGAPKLVIKTPLTAGKTRWLTFEEPSHDPSAPLRFVYTLDDAGVARFRRVLAAFDLCREVVEQGVGLSELRVEVTGTGFALYYDSAVKMPSMEVVGEEPKGIFVTIGQVHLELSLKTLVTYGRFRVSSAVNNKEFVTPDFPVSMLLD